MIVILENLTRTVHTVSYNTEYTNRIELNRIKSEKVTTEGHRTHSIA